jgi:hypothetical protein
MKHRLIQTSPGSQIEKLKALYKEQLNNWPLLQKGVTELGGIKKRHVSLDGEQLIIQFNPARMASVAAKVDQATIKARPCFLCAENLPPEQGGIILGQDTVALANPMPIFDEHFTLTHPNHCRQDISDKMGELLDVSKELGASYAVFFNGAKAGASAPDHHHLQSCPADSFPLIQKLRGHLLPVSLIKHIDETKIETALFCKNRYLVLSGPNKISLEKISLEIFAIFSKIHTDGADLINVLSLFSGGIWQILIILREKHRSSHFFAEEPNKLMISPATVEMSGVIVTARESDFDKISPEDIRAIYSEVTLNTLAFNEVLNAIQKL